MGTGDTVPQIDRILADAVTRSLDESDGHTIDAAAAATLARTVVPDLLAKVEKLTAERDEARRALARAERAERVVGYRKAIADLRDDEAFAVWADQHLDVNNPEDWPIDIARVTLAAVEVAEGTVLAGAAKLRVATYEAVLRDLAAGEGIDP